jgi:hypothetical protein
MASYKVQHSLVGPFSAGTVVTDEQVKSVGGDLEFWKRAGAVREVHGDEAQPIADDDPVLTDAALKATIERRIREQATNEGKYNLTPQEQAKIVAEETSKNTKRLENRDNAHRNPARPVGSNPQIAGQPQGPNPTPAPPPGTPKK